MVLRADSQLHAAFKIPREISLSPCHCKCGCEDSKHPGSHLRQSPSWWYPTTLSAPRWCHSTPQSIPTIAEDDEHLKKGKCDVLFFQNSFFRVAFKGQVRHFLSHPKYLCSHSEQPLHCVLELQHHGALTSFHSMEASALDLVLTVLKVTLLGATEISEVQEEVEDDLAFSQSFCPAYS